MSGNDRLKVPSCLLDGCQLRHKLDISLIIVDRLIELIESVKLLLDLEMHLGEPVFFWDERKVLLFNHLDLISNLDKRSLPRCNELVLRSNLSLNLSELSLSLEKFRLLCFESHLQF